jgi:hypothetical protein
MMGRNLVSTPACTLLLTLNKVPIKNVMYDGKKLSARRRNDLKQKIDLGFGW